MIRPEESASTKFSLMHRRRDYSDGGTFGDYEFREVNKVFEERHIEMFKIVPLCVGSFINLEKSMRIDAIEYTRQNTIKLWVTEESIY